MTSQPHAETRAFENLNQLKKNIVTFYTQKAQQKQFKDLQIHLNALNPQLRLPKCQAPVQLTDHTFEKSGKVAGRHTLKVACTTPPWKIYVSIFITGKVPAVKTTKVILKNAVIKESDIQQIWLPAQRAAPDRVIFPQTAIGMRARRNLRSEKILTAKDLTPPYWVIKKNEVTLITQLNGLTVKAKGIALQSGVQGQQISVKNKHSGKKIKGIVTAPNTVTIP